MKITHSWVINNATNPNKTFMHPELHNIATSVPKAVFVAEATLWNMRVYSAVVVTTSGTSCSVKLITARPATLPASRSRRVVEACSGVTMCRGGGDTWNMRWYTQTYEHLSETWEISLVFQVFPQFNKRDQLNPRHPPPPWVWACLYWHHIDTIKTIFHNPKPS